MSEKAVEILNAVFQAYENNEESLKLKMPEGGKIHEFNMALKELTEKGFLEIIKKNMTLAEVSLTENGLEFLMKAEG